MLLNPGFTLLNAVISQRLTHNPATMTLLFAQACISMRSITLPIRLQHLVAVHVHVTCCNAHLHLLQLYTTAHSSTHNAGVDSVDHTCAPASHDSQNDSAVFPAAYFLTAFSLCTSIQYSIGQVLQCADGPMSSIVCEQVCMQEECVG